MNAVAKKVDSMQSLPKRSEMLSQMVMTQQAVNARIDPGWTSKRRPWMRAIWTKSALLMDSYGWKWWSKKNKDIESFRLELVNIWHFALSASMEQKLTEQWFGGPALNAAPHDYGQENDEAVCKLIEQMAEDALGGTFDFQVFLALLEVSGLTFEDFYVLYIGKAVLNIFRQDYGYKSGSYRQDWCHGMDNKKLMQALGSLPNDMLTLEGVYSALNDLYLSAD